jgi:hypothetical protein
MPSHVLWAIVWALPAMVAVLAIPLYMRFVRARRVSVMQAIAVPAAVIGVGIVLLVTPVLWAILTGRHQP